MATLAGKAELTIIFMGLDNAGFPLKHAAFEVTWQVTISAFAGVYV